jgi:hypothetical protein
MRKIYYRKAGTALVARGAMLLNIASKILFSPTFSDFGLLYFFGSVILLSIDNVDLMSAAIKLLLSKDEEWRGFISEQKHGWIKAGLTKQQINRKIVLFFFTLQWGRFKDWIKLLRILSWVKIR